MDKPDGNHYIKKSSMEDAWDKMLLAAMKKFWSYENKMVAVCMLCFGFEMFDRFAITNLSPFIMTDLNMTNADLGLVMGVFAFD